MNHDLKLPWRALELIKKSEGLRLEAYLCPANVLTIGYGHTRTVVPDQCITRIEAEALLKEDLTRFEEGVKQLVKVPINNNQFGALVSLAFNIGLGAFGSSTLLAKLNASDMIGAAEQFALWRNAGGKVNAGLVARRAAEADLFFSPVVGQAREPLPQAVEIDDNGLFEF